MTHDQIATFARWMADSGATAGMVASFVEKPWKWEREALFMDKHAEDCAFGFACAVLRCESCHNDTTDCNLVLIVTEEIDERRCPECRKERAA